MNILLIVYNLLFIAIIIKLSALYNYIIKCPVRVSGLELYKNFTIIIIIIVIIVICLNLIVKILNIMAYAIYIFCK